MASQAVKQEAQLKSELRKTSIKCLPEFVIQRHEDVRYEGVPDFSFTGLVFTSWWEVKHATPSFTDKQNQRMRCLALAKSGYCRYIIFQENAKAQDKRTLIVHPKELQSLHYEACFEGYDHAAVCSFIYSVHLNYGHPS